MLELLQKVWDFLRIILKVCIHGDDHMVTLVALNNLADLLMKRNRSAAAVPLLREAVEIGRRLLDKIHLGVAVDTPEGLFVAVLQDVASRTPESLRAGLQKMKEAVSSRNVPAEELRGYTITLSNFGRYGGRYATPVIVP